MKILVSGAIALSITGAVAVAGGEDWADLDRAVQELTSSLDETPAGPRVGGYFITQYASSSDIDVGTGELGGFQLPYARIAVEGMQGEYEYRLEYDFSENTLKDALARFPIAQGVNGMIGNYKSPVLLNGLVTASRQFFFDRSALSRMWSGRDLGFQLYGGFDNDVLNWFLSVQNGADSVMDDYLFTGRVQFNLIGEAFRDPKFKGVDGAQDGTDEPSVEVGISGFDDGGVEDGNGFGGDVFFKTNVFSMGGEMLDLGDGVSGATDPEGDQLNGFVSNYYGVGNFGGLSLEDNSTPFAFQATYMISSTENNITGWEVGARYQDFDNLASDTLIEFGIRRYLSGHNLKWGLFYITTDSDVVENEFDLIGLDFVLGF